ncbi:MAG: hypothetical protein AAGI48_18225, partial [Verrucomicrobiota bacterium]
DDSVTFTATASDDEDGDIAASLAWSSDVDGPIGTGDTFNYSLLTPGPHVITASVTDSGSAVGSDSVSITVNAKPVVAISSPADSSTSNEDDSVTFTATASDDEDGDIAASLAWSSDVDGPIGTGDTFNYALLTPGPHVITATATDSGSAEGSDSVSITVNAKPVVVITSPADASTSNDGDSVTFTATATDAEEGSVAASLSWSSDVDGIIGTGATFNYAALTPGLHVITATATDSGSAEGSDSVSIAVNARPVVDIVTPTDSAVFDEGDVIAFEGTATDAEEGDLTASLIWSSDVTGLIGFAGSFNFSSLPVGTHVITASATDGGSFEGTDTVTIRINAKPVVAISSPADSSSALQGASVTFTATATDNEDGNIAASLSWTSSLDGPIGTGATFSTTSLTVGEHTVTASVTDSDAASGEDTVTITITAGNTFETWLADNGYTSGGFNTDSDGNGLNDGTEYFFNQSPNDAGDLGNLPRIVKNGNDLELHFTRLTLIDDASGVLQVSSTLGGWVPAVVDVDYEVVSETPVGDETDVVYKLLRPAPAFWRMSVNLNP